MSTRNPVVPKNGKFIVAMMVGGPADIYKEIRDRLNEKMGIHMPYHVEYQKVRQFQNAAIKKDVDVVVFIKSQIGHAFGEILTDKLKGTGVRLIRTQHKWSTMSSILKFHIDQREPVTEKELFEAKKAGRSQEKPWTRELELVPQPEVVSAPPTDALALTPESQRVVEHLALPVLRFDKDRETGIITAFHTLLSYMKQVGCKSLLADGNTVDAEFPEGRLRWSSTSL